MFFDCIYYYLLLVLVFISIINIIMLVQRFDTTIDIYALQV